MVTDPAVLLFCDNDMWPLRLAWRERGERVSMEHYLGVLQLSLEAVYPPIQLAGAQSQDPSGAVGGDWCEEVTNAQEDSL